MMWNRKQSEKIQAIILMVTLLGSSCISCSDAEESESDRDSTGTETKAEEVTPEAGDSRFAGVDFNGRAFRVLSSSDDYDATNAHALIAGTGTMNGDIVNDTVYQRNEEVSDLLNIRLEFTETDYTYQNAAENLRKLVLAGEDLYDVIINDLSALAPLSLEGLFMNINNVPEFDLTQNYWYDACMKDLMLSEGKKFVMAGDWFMDIIGSCHALFLNKDMLENLYGDPDFVYHQVLEGSWTLDSMIQLSAEAYADLDGNAKRNKADRYGIWFVGTWGCAIPFVIASSVDYVDRTEDMPVFSVNNEKSVRLLDTLNEVFWGDGALTVNRADTEDDVSGYLRRLFANEQSLFLAYNRLQDLSRMRDIPFEFGVIPYPKLDESDDYITSLHLTSEMGAIPITVSDLHFITTVIEVLNDKTKEILIPEYYESALKVKYTTDKVSAQMIDLIHDNFGSAFPLAYNKILDGILLGCFTENLNKKSTDFASLYQKKEAQAQKKLEEAFETLESIAQP